MNEELDQQPDLWTLAGQLSTADDGDHFFARLVTETKDYSNPGMQSLLRTGIRTLIENSKADPESARMIIEKYILPRCLGQDSLLPLELLLDRDAREILSAWVEQYSDESRIPLRAALLERTAQAVEQSSSEASINTLAAFGLRSPWIERILGRLTGRRGAVGDAAINALCSLSPGGVLRSHLISAVIRRASSRPAGELNFAIQELASGRFIPILHERLRSGSMDLWTEPFLLGRIADRSPGDDRLQSRVWRVFEEVLQRDTNSARRILATGNTFANCNAPEVVQYLLANIGKPGLDTHSAYNHLKICCRPEQLRGWRTDLTGLKARLTEFAILPGSQTRSVTIQDTVRQAAWEIAFCAGMVDVSDWLAKADTHSPLSVAEMLTYASFAPPREWPSFVPKLITEQLDIGAGGDLWYSARLAAARMVAATESPAALELLLNCGLTGEGAPLISTTRLAADIAERLSTLGPDELVEHLFGISENRARSHAARMSAIAGLQRLADLKLMRPLDLDRLVSLAADTSLPNYAVAAVIWILGTFEGVPPGNALRALLVEYLESAEASEEIRFQSLQSLIHLGIWSDYQQIVLRALNLLKPLSDIDAAHVRGYRGWKAYALGLLVSRAPDAYRVAARQLLESSSGEAVHLLLRALDRGPGVRQDVAEELGRAAIDRSARVLGMNFGETDNFEIIARLAPGEFLLAGWENLWGDWMPQVRCALADSLKNVPSTNTPGEERILDLLRELSGDSTYMVRRCAYRAYSRVDSTKLRELCLKWMRSGQTELRIRSAESAQWLPVDNSKSMDNDILRDLLEDPEPSVRAAAKRSTAELRKSEWRAFALARMKCGDDWARNGIAAIYAYGRALASLSDDEAIAAINQMRREPDIPINVRNWLAKLADDAAQHWKETTQSWPDLLPAWSGQIEEMEAEFAVDDHQYNARISLWQRRQQDPSDRISWGGGFFEPALDERMRMVFAPKPGPLGLRIKGRHPAQILYNSMSSDGRILFLGTGPYPKPEQQ